LPFPKGFRLGAYEILSPLGEGGMGEVYRAMDPRLGRQVAIKVISEGRSLDPDSRRRFEREARAIAALSHPNVLAIHEFGESDGVAYAVTELLEGETLQERLSAGALPERKALAFAVQIARGLAAAHEKGIVHRDLKPANIFVTRDGSIKILDFGLAKTQPARTTGSDSRADSETASAAVMGTAGYMSPEQLRGRPVDARSDIFAFGAILFEMLTGRRAFGGDSSADMMSAILSREPEFPESSASSPSLRRIVLRCLEKDPEERFHSTRDLVFALGEIADSASQPAPPRRPDRSRLAAVAVLVLLLAAGALFFANVGGVRDRISRGVGAPRIESLAVLPLENLSRDPDQEYFADGMTEALITDVSRIGTLRVISRNSVMRLKGTRKSLPEIGRDLHVDAAITGTVLRAGDRIRITAQLIDAATDRTLWAESYERDLRDVIALQRDLARAIAAAVRVKLTADEKTRLQGGRAVDPGAHEEYLKGRYHWNKRTVPALQEAIAHFRRAIEKEPDYALAYAGISDCYVLSPSIGGFPTVESMQQANSAARKALDIDDSIAEAHASLAYERLFSWEWQVSEREFRRALDLNPSYAVGHFWYGVLLAARGRLDEAIAESKRGQSLDPISPILTAAVSWMNHFARRYDVEVEQARRTLDLEPNFVVGHWRKALGLAQMSRFDEAIAAGRRAVELSNGNPDIVGVLGYIYALAGRRGEAEAVLKQLEEESARRYVSAYNAAIIRGALGERDSAFAALEKALAERTFQMAHVKVEPSLDSLRSDPRFPSFITRVGAPP
jgi:serine/threonine-protein kinase